jgi:uncharacterized RDD family membrane protein YckC
MSERTWFFVRGGQEGGPLPESAVLRMFDEGFLDRFTSVRSDPQTEWNYAQDVEPFAALFSLSASAQASAKAPAASPIGGFWNRAIARFLDSIVLGLVGLLLSLVGLVLSGAGVPLLEQLRAWGRGVGLVIALAYHGSLDSALGGGQTLGKRVMRLRVVGKDGAPITLPRSLVRAALPLVPWALSGLDLPGLAAQPVAVVPVTSVLLVVGLGDVLLYLANRRSRQALHDLVCGTYVVWADAQGAIVLQPSRRVYVAFAAYVLAAVALAIVTTQVSLLGLSPEEGRLARLVQQRIQEEQPVTSAQVSVGTMYGSTVSTRYIQVVARWRGRPENWDQAANNVAAALLKTYPGAVQVNSISVSIVTGYDIGLWSSFSTATTTLSPADWKRRLAVT